MSTSGIKSWNQLNFGGNKQAQDQTRTEFMRLRMVITCCSCCY